MGIKLENIGENFNCLDLGCGSGILGIYLEKYKNCFCDYVDVDPDALDNCKENILLNDLPARENIFLRNKFRGKEYDVVIANILLPVLKIESDLIKTSLKKDSILVMSGILNSQLEELTSYYRDKNIISEVLSVSRKNDWCAVAMRK